MYEQYKILLEIHYVSLENNEIYCYITEVGIIWFDFLKTNAIISDVNCKM